MSKFISVQFFGDSSQCYTYKNRYKTKVLNKGDFVVVPTPQGKTVVKVISVDIPTPQFECKEIIKKVRL